MDSVQAECDYSFRSALARMHAAGRVTAAPADCHTDLDISGILKENDGDTAIYFPEVRDHAMPVVGNFLASQPNCEAAFGTDFRGIRKMVSRGLANSIAPVLVEDGPCREVQILENIDLGVSLPALKHAPGDAGRFITAGVVIVRHPHTGVYNASYHRLQLLGGNRTAIKMDMGRHLRSAFEAARKDGVGLPISVAIGTDISLLYAAAVMGSRMPESKDEIMAAGAMQGRGIEMLPGLTQDVLVPASSEIVLEGVISPTETVHEGPFGEFMGYHSDEGPAPVVEITALTHRKDAIYYAINGAGRETVMLRKYVLEASAMDVLENSVPIVTDVNMTTGGLHRFHLNIAVRKESSAHDGLQRNAALAAFGALKDLLRVVVVDDDIDIHSEVDVEYAIASRVEASSDVLKIPGMRGHEYVRVSQDGISTKWIVDATVPFAEQSRFRRIPFKGSSPGLSLTTTPNIPRLENS
jgi:2,5-furandicarboxylate decarboxylase 1